MIKIRIREGNEMKTIAVVLLLLGLILAGTVLAEERGPEAVAKEMQKSEVSPSQTPSTSPKVDAGDTSWVLFSAALVMLMTPGLALFYGGMVRRKNVLGTIMQSFITLALISIQ